MASIREFKEISLDDLEIGTGQVRLRDIAKDIGELAESIRKVGLLEPIVVCDGVNEGKYEIITGQRRFLAHQQLDGIDTIWAAVLDEPTTEIEAKVLSITENLVRRDLNYRDLIDACTYLYNQYGSLKTVADETGLPYNKVREYVKYDQLIPELKSLVDTSEITVPVALRAQRAASVMGETDAEEAIQFAKEMAPLSGAQQQKIVSEREKDNSLSAEQLIEDAKSGGRITQIVVTLSTEVRNSLQEYANQERTTVDDAAGKLIKDGLYVNDFLGDDQL